MRKLASIQRVWKIEPIEGADRIELSHVLGWQFAPTEPVFCPLISASLSMKVVSNKYLLKNDA